MATRTRIAGSADWNSAAHWSGAATPVDGDTIIIPDIADNITTNMDQSLIDPANFIVRGFRGTLGTSATPLRLGTVTRMEYDAPECLSCNLNITTLTRGVVSRASNTASALYFTAGTLTELNVLSGLGIRIGAATATLLQMECTDRSLAKVYIEAGATLTTLTQLGGIVEALCAATTVNLDGGEFHFVGDTKTLTALNQTGGLFVFSSPSGTFTAGTIRGGYWDASRDPDPKTVTNVTFHRRATYHLGGTHVTYTNAPVSYGATGWRGTQAVTEYIGAGAEV